MERRKAQHRCCRAPHGRARAMASKRAPPCGAPSTLRASAETSPATRGHAKGGEPPDAIRCGVLFRPRIRAGLERDAGIGGKAKVDASSALSRRVLRSAPRRKRQLPVVGAGGSPQPPGWPCASRAARAPRFTPLSRTPPDSAPHE